MQESIAQLVALLKGIWKYRWYATAIAWVTAIVGSMVVFLLPNTYQATSRVHVDTQNILKPLLASMTSMPNMEQQVMIMSRTLLSRPNIEKLIRMVDMDIHAGTGKSRDQLIEELGKEIKIVSAGRDDIYTITYSDPNPKLAKEVVQSLLTIFVEDSFADKKQDSGKAIIFLEEQIKTYERKLVTAENALKEFKLTNSEILPNQSGLYASKVQETAELLREAKLHLVEAEQSRNAIRKQLAGERPVLIDEQRTVQSLSPTEARLQTLEKNLDYLQQHYTDQHPDMIATKRLIAELEARRTAEALRSGPSSPSSRTRASPVTQQLNVALSEAEANVAALKARVDEYSKRHQRAREMSAAVPEVDAKLAQLNRDYEINKDNYEKLIERREAARLSGEMTATADMIKFRIIDPPIVPARPTGPNRVRLLAAVLALSVAAGLGIALVLSQLRPTFLSAATLREMTALPVLGSVSMNWTDKEVSRRRRSQVAFGLSLASLVIVFGGLMSSLLIKS